MQYFNHYYFNKYRNSEIPEFTNMLLDIVAKHNPEALKIAGMYQRLLGLQPQLATLAAKHEFCHKPLKLSDYREERQKTLSVIIAQLRAARQIERISPDRDRESALSILKKYLNGFWQEVEAGRSGRINQMIADIKADNAIVATFDTMGISPFINQLEICQTNINRIGRQHIENVSAKGKSNNIEVRKRIGVAISNLLNAIEVATIDHPEIDFMPLINELNALIQSKATSIKSRSAHNKNTANKTTTAALSPTTTATAI